MFQSIPLFTTRRENEKILLSFYGKMLEVQELRNGLFILIDDTCGEAFPKTFPSYNLISHFLNWYSPSPDGTIEESYQNWKNIFFKDGIVSERNFKKDQNVIRLLENFFDSLEEDDVEIAQIGACGFADWLVKNGFAIVQVDELDEA